MRKWQTGQWVAGSIVTLLCAAAPALAQIMPDGTLGAERSILTPSDRIEGGATRGANLFHSFREFNVGELQRVYFANPAGISNILTRVTGSTRSEIRGVLGVDGGANLFLLNPNGILFGPNASLDIRGSFVASTASGFKFGDGSEFSATDPQAPPLLMVNVPIGLQYGTQVAQPIDVIGSHLEASPGTTLALIGGDVNLHNAELIARGGRVELGGLAKAGAIGLSMENKVVSLTFNQTLALANVLINESEISVNGTFVTFIPLVANTSEVSFSVPRIVIPVGSLPPRPPLPLEPGSSFESPTEASNSSESTGSNTSLSTPASSNELSATTNKLAGGHIVVNAQNIGIFSSNLSTGSPSGSFGVFSTARAGSIELKALGLLKLNNSNIQALSDLFSEDPSGRILLQSRFLESNDTQISTTTRGTGSAGNIQIGSSDSIFLFSTSIRSIVETPGEGSVGNISISSNNLSLIGSEVNTFRNAFVASGTTGDININISGGINISNSQVSTLGGNGTININAGSLSLSNHSSIQNYNTFSKSGDINISVQEEAAISSSLISSDVDFLFAITSGTGNISFVTNQLLLSDSTVSTSLGGFTLTGFERKAGNISFHASNSISILNSTVSTTAISFMGIGSVKAGDIMVTAESLHILNNSSLDTSTGTTGRGGDITVEVNKLEASDSAQLSTTTFSTGAAGNIILRVSDDALISGKSSGLFADTAPDSSGKGGSIDVWSNRLSILNGASLTVSSQGLGVAGDVAIISKSALLSGQASIRGETLSTNGGNISLQVQDFLMLRHGSLISTSAGTANAGGNGGNITISNASGFVLAVSSENSDIRANAFEGRGGNVNITTQGIYGLQFRKEDTPFSDITASSQLGVDGTVQVATLGIDPSQGLAPVIDQPRDSKVDQGCQATGKTTTGRFAITGRGGVPLNPNQVRSRDALWSDRASPSVAASPPPAPESPIVEAQGLVTQPDGSVYLTANTTATQPPILLTSHCNVR